jgi:drug/metabolite transporter (DMT)-like permease
MFGHLALAAVTLSLAIGQVLFKQASFALRGQPFREGLLRLAVTPTLYAGLILYALSTLLWIWVLSRMPLAQAYPWVAACSAIVPVLGWFLFGERFAPSFWLGVALIFAGIALTQHAIQHG